MIIASLTPHQDLGPDATSRSTPETRSVQGSPKYHWRQNRAHPRVHGGSICDPFHDVAGKICDYLRRARRMTEYLLEGLVPT